MYFFEFYEYQDVGCMMKNAIWFFLFLFFVQIWSCQHTTIFSLNTGVRSQGGGLYDRCVGDNIVYVCDLWGEVGSDLPSHVSLLFFLLFFQVLVLKGKKGKRNNPIIFLSNLIKLGLGDGEGRGGRQPICSFLFLLWYMYLSGMWFGVTPRTDTKTTCVQKSLDRMLKLW
jgi:hypothetical protein